MRKIILCLCLSLFSIFKNSVWAQNYKPMLTGFTEWQVALYYEQVPSVDFYTAWGDTTIDGQSYQFLNYFHFNNNFVIRENTDSGRVYIRIPVVSNQNRDFLVYDFSLNPGDTISVYNPASPAPMGPITLHVDSVKTFNTLVDQRKALYLSQRNSRDSAYSPTLWVEGIGSFSLINTPTESPNLSTIGALKCFYQNGTAVILEAFEGFDPCSQNFVGIEKKENWNIQLYPNPSTGPLRVKLSNHRAAQMQVIDLNGQVVFESLLDPTDFEVNLKHLRPGAYLILLTANGQQMRQVWLKTD